MIVLQEILVGLVATLHIIFFVLEKIIWNMPLGQKIFKITAEQAISGSVLAANQGVYNLLLAVGLIWTLISHDALSSTPVRYFILMYIIGVGVYGAISVGSNILFMQVIPATLALAMQLANSGLPAINDISTNLNSPPTLFSAIDETCPDPRPHQILSEACRKSEPTPPTAGRGNIEGDSKNNLDFAPGETKLLFAAKYSDEHKSIHLKNYPQIQPAFFPNHSPNEAFNIVKEVASTMPNWEIEVSDQKNLVVAGSQTTQFMRFVDDFIIKVYPKGQGAEIHMRSKSRLGRSDFGKNATRIASFYQALSQRTTRLE